MRAGRLDQACQLLLLGLRSWRLRPPRRGAPTSARAVRARASAVSSSLRRLQPDLLDAVVDGADLVLLDLPRSAARSRSAPATSSASRACRRRRPLRPSPCRRPSAATGVPRSGPYSRRSTRQTPGGRSRAAISSSSIHLKSEPSRSRLPTLSCSAVLLRWSGWPGSGIASPARQLAQRRRLPSLSVTCSSGARPEEPEAVRQDDDDAGRRSSAGRRRARCPVSQIRDRRGGAAAFARSALIRAPGTARAGAGGSARRRC